MKIETFKSWMIPQIIELWNEELPQDRITADDFVRWHLADMNFSSDLFLCAIEDKKVVGFLFGIKRKIAYYSRGTEPDKCWIKVMAVDKSNQRMGVGTALLKIFEERMQAESVKKIILGAYSPSYIFCGIDKENYPKAKHFFEKHAYNQTEEAFGMERSLDNFTYLPSAKLQKEKLVQDGFQFIPYSAEYAMPLLMMIGDNFSDGWLSYVIEAIQNGTAEDTLILAVHGENVAGYVSRASIGGDPERYGPFGVDENYRDHKVGSVLINEMFENMCRAGVHHMYFKSTEENGRRFYERQGVEVTRTFGKYEKSL